MRFLPLALVLGLARIAAPDEHHLARPHADPGARVTVPVQTIQGTRIGCVVVPTSSLHTLLGFRHLHAVACVEATTGEVIVAVLHRNGTVQCTGSGYLDPNNLTCANATVCGIPDYYCLF
jgi:hypothetical protein